jgi:type IV pilus biogenesis protein PilP
MRIANKSFLSKQIAGAARLAFFSALGSFLLVSSATEAYAVDVPASPPTIVAPPAALAAQIPPPAMGVQISSPVASAKSPDADIAKTLTTMEEKVSENAKGLMKSLDNASDPVMLEDLNTARQTVARIEAMIDIEKHLADLDKLRNERSGGGHMSSSVPTLANALPASVLTQPLPLQPNMSSDMGEMHMAPRSGIEIARITGTDGKYTALLKMAGGETKSVKVGDHIFDDTTVRSISSSSVEIEKNGEPRTLQIKNIDTIYSAMR